jgi:hypothetical protein
MHSGKVDVSFLKAVFRAASYDPSRRYASGVEMAQDITPAAAPVGRVRPNTVDFGVVEDAAPKEVVLQCYNVGGGTLHGEISADSEWLEISTQGNALGRAAALAGNRQTVRVVAYPERIPPGTEAAGRLFFSFPGFYQEVPVRLRRAVQVASVTTDPPALRVNVAPGGTGTAKLRFHNQGDAPANVRLIPPPGVALALSAVEFVLPPHARQEVTVSMDAAVVGEAELNTVLHWAVEGNPRPEIPVNAAVRRGAGLLSALTSRFKK